MHFLVNRIDEDGNLNDDTFLLNRAFMAAQIINQRRGWKSTLDRSDVIKKDDDEEEWARKCARQAVKMRKPKMVKHAIAKPKYRRR